MADYPATKEVDAVPVGPAVNEGIEKTVAGRQNVQANGQEPTITAFAKWITPVKPGNKSGSAAERFSDAR